MGFMAEEVEGFRQFMLDMEADMVKVGGGGDKESERAGEMIGGGN